MAVDVFAFFRFGQNTCIYFPVIPSSGWQAPYKKNTCRNDVVAHDWASSRSELVACAYYSNWKSEYWNALNKTND